MILFILLQKFNSKIVFGGVQIQNFCIVKALFATGHERKQESKKTKKCNIAVIYYMNIQTEKPIEEYK